MCKVFRIILRKLLRLWVRNTCDFVNRAGLPSFQDFYLNVACPDKCVVLVGNVCAGTVARVEVVV